MRVLATALRLLSLIALFVFAQALPVRAEGVPPLVSTTWLKQHLQDPDVLVLDVRSAIDLARMIAFIYLHPAACERYAMRHGYPIATMLRTVYREGRDFWARLEQGL